MKLADWLEKRAVTQIDFAASIGVTPGFVSQLCSGTSRPGIKTLEAIHRHTRGAVTAADFFNERAA